MASEPTVLIMAGGTGGHVFPALAVAEVLAARGVAVHWLGTELGIEAHLVPKAGYSLHPLRMTGLRGKNPLSRLLAAAKAGKAVLQSMALLRKLKPFCVLGMGGYASGPGGVAARLLAVPVVIHEQNAVAGTTNRLLARLARVCLTGYPIALGGAKARYIGNPVRREIADLPPPAQRWQDRSGPLHVLVLGGSQGAKALNDAVVACWGELPAELRPTLWHQTGKAHEDTVTRSYSAAGVVARAEAFIDDMAAAYAWADLVVCRAGALTVAELAAAGVPAVLVPLPHAIDDHQRANAAWFAKGGGGEIIDQQYFDSAWLKAYLLDLGGGRQRLLSKANAARQLAKPDAAVAAAEQCMEYAHGE